MPNKIIPCHLNRVAHTDSFPAMKKKLFRATPTVSHTPRLHNQPKHSTILYQNTMNCPRQFPPIKEFPTCRNSIKNMHESMTECVQFPLNNTIISTPLEQHDHWNPKRVAPATLLGFQCLIWRRRLDLGSLPDFIANRQALEQKNKKRRADR